MRSLKRKEVVFKKIIQEIRRECLPADGSSNRPGLGQLSEW